MTTRSLGIFDPPTNDNQYGDDEWVIFEPTYNQCEDDNGVIFDHANNQYGDDEGVIFAATDNQYLLTMGKSLTPMTTITGKKM